jgi:hypothetical protein
MHHFLLFLSHQDRAAPLSCTTLSILMPCSTHEPAHFMPKDRVAAPRPVAGLNLRKSFIKTQCRAKAATHDLLEVLFL